MSASPTTISGPGTQTFAFVGEAAHTALMGPTSGSSAPTFRQPTLADVAAGVAAAGTYDFSGASIVLPVTPGGTATANGQALYDSTNLNWHVWDAGADSLMATFVAGGITSGHCTEFQETGASLSLADAGAPCGSGGGGGTSVTVNGGGTLSTLALNGSTPAPDASFIASTFKISGANAIVELPYGSASTIGALKCGTGLTCASGTASVTGGSSGIPANLVQAFTGTSWTDDDNETQATTITVSSWTCTAGVCTFVNSGANGFLAGDWVNVRYLSSWFAVPSPYALGTGYTLFQVLPTGLSSTGFKFNYALNTGSCSSSCGTVESAMNNLPFAATAAPGQPSTAQANTVVLLASPVTLGGIASNFAAMFAAYNPGTTGNPLVVTLSDPWNDIGLCESVATIEGYYSSIFAAAHAWTSTRVMVLSPMAKNTSQAFGAGFCTFPVAPQVEAIQIDQWLQTTANPNLAVRANGEHWDYYLDAGAVYNDAYDTGLLYGSPTAWQKLGQMYTNCLAAGGCEPLSGMRWRFGNANNADSSAGNGYNMVPIRGQHQDVPMAKCFEQLRYDSGDRRIRWSVSGFNRCRIWLFQRRHDSGTAALRLTNALTTGGNAIAIVLPVRAARRAITYT